MASNDDSLDDLDLQIAARKKQRNEEARKEAARLRHVKDEAERQAHEQLYSEWRSSDEGRRKIRVDWSFYGLIALTLAAIALIIFASLHT